ncbi:MAG: hypothetical protein J0J01_14310 [Reyranella sp.]|uniref:hypothetical protein n=1 Tax=Reyranella sp. TaxID=1929291 RepID=UPI001ACC6FE0|nr:hypothetical protein [Reyranella sp.]MBN9088079.1 hypothetical protein [Reyranella sp.]
MRGRSLRQAALMIGGALVLVQALVVVLESQARPAAVDPSFVAEMQQAQHSAGSRYVAPLSRRN